MQASGLTLSTFRPRAMQLSLEEHVVSFVRTICAVLLVFFLLPNVVASAGDYTVSYAFDAGDVNDAGKTEECEFAHVCWITSEKLNLTILLSFFIRITAIPNTMKCTSRSMETMEEQSAAILQMASVQLFAMLGPWFGFMSTKGEGE